MITPAAFEHYGIDPDEYGETVDYGGLDWCPVCSVHAATDPLPRCDLELARAADMEAEGFDVKFCPHCAQGYPAITAKGGLCPACRRKDIQKKAELSRQREGRRPSRVGGAYVYVEDGLGCVEKLPQWMVDWDGNPGHKEPR